MSYGVCDFLFHKLSLHPCLPCLIFWILVVTLALCPVNIRYSSSWGSWNMHHLLAHTHACTFIFLLMSCCIFIITIAIIVLFYMILSRSPLCSSYTCTPILPYLLQYIHSHRSSFSLIILSIIYFAWFLTGKSFLLNSFHSFPISFSLSIHNLLP